MSDREVEDYLLKIQDGLQESRKQLLQEYALHDESIVVGDGQGNVLDVSAKQVLAQHPELSV